LDVEDAQHNIDALTLRNQSREEVVVGVTRAV